MSGYKVLETCGCVLLFSDPPEAWIPVHAFSIVTKRLGKKALMDLDLARIWGAMIVAGPKSGLDELRNDPETLRRADAIKATLPATLPDAAVHWAVWGEQGVSSRTMFRAATQLWPPRHRQQKGYPRDVGDVRRCLLLLDQVPIFRPALDRWPGRTGTGPPSGRSGTTSQGHSRRSARIGVAPPMAWRRGRTP